MKQSKEKPPVYDRCVEQFGVDWRRGVIITYGDTIHCRWKIKEPKLTHEKTHIQQQLEYGVEEWWNRYFIDEKFRLDQELEAYLNEIEWIKKHIWDLKVKEKLLDKIASDLGSSMYGDILSYKQARKMLKLKS